MVDTSCVLVKLYCALWAKSVCVCVCVCVCVWRALSGLMKALGYDIFRFCHRGGEKTSS